MTFSETQAKVLRMFKREPNMPQRVASGHGSAPRISAANALVRKGLLRHSYATGIYSLTDEGRRHVKDAAIAQHEREGACPPSTTK